MIEYLVINDYSKDLNLEACEAESKSCLKIEPGVPKKYRDFSYHDAGWRGRKICAMTLMPVVWTGLVCTVMDVAKLIFLGLPAAFSDKGLSIKRQLYHIHADLCQALGWLCTLYDDKRGQFYIQRSDYRKSCYNANAGIKPKIDRKAKEAEEARIRQEKEEQARKTKEAKGNLEKIVDSFTDSLEAEEKKKTEALVKHKKGYERLKNEIQEIENAQEPVDNGAKRLLRGKSLQQSNIKRLIEELEKKRPTIEMFANLIEKMLKTTEELSDAITVVLLEEHKERLLENDPYNMLADFFKDLQPSEDAA